jgi:hypothetical protein
MKSILNFTTLFLLLLLSACKEQASPPYLSEAWVDEIGAYDAQIKGNVLADGGSEVNTRGFCWSLQSNPTINNEKTAESGGNGAYQHLIKPLEQKTLYYVRPYAINGSGVGYGKEVSFTTNEAYLFIETRKITSITDVSAVSGGIVQKGMGTTILGKGVCWSTKEQPTVDDNKTSDGAIMQNYTSTITGLKSNTSYYVRTYVISNTQTIYYGNDVTFTTK